MNHEETQSHFESAPIDAELEARIVAWVAGEASAFEIAELERIAAARPEIEAFRKRMAAVYGLVDEALRPVPQPLRLSEEKRVKLLGTIGIAQAFEASPSPKMTALPEVKRVPIWNRSWIYGAAASVAIGIFVLRQADTWYAEKSRAVDIGLSDRNVAVWSNQKASKATADEGYFAPMGDAEMRAREFDVRGGTAVHAEPPSAKFRVSLNSPTTPTNNALAFGPLPSTETTTGARQRSLGEEKTETLLKSKDLTLGSAASPTTGGKSYFGPAASGAIMLGQDKRPALQSDTVFDAPARQDTTGFGKVGIGGSLSAAKPAATPVVPAPADDSVIQLSAFTVSSSSLGAAAAPLVDKKQKAAAASANEAGLKNDAAKEKERLEARPNIVVPGLTPAAPPVPPQAESNALAEPNSTFSLHVSDASFRVAQATLQAMERGENPRSPEIRAEEFYNAFNYGDPAPSALERVACRVEQSAHPVLQQRNLVRIAMQVAATGRLATQPLHLTVLLDTSGSMEREDRAIMVRRAMEVLVSLLKPEDRLTLIGFARQPRLLAENLRGDQVASVLQTLARTPAEGGTNIEEALKLGGELARRHHAAGGQNRIVVLTDGAANLGNAEPAQLVATVERLREQGIAFDACGVGLEGTGDTVLEALTRKGNGRYYVLNTAEDADTGFARQLAGAFRPAAENVKVQVRFNAGRVGHYRLIGFDAHRLRTEDFHNDAVDAAELAAEEAAVALYQVEALPQGTGDIGEVYVRFRDVATGGMVEQSWPIPYVAQAPAFDRAPPSMQLAGIAALLAEKFQESPLSQQFKLGDFAGVVNGLRTHYSHDPRVQELVTMFGQVRRFTGE